MDDDPRAVRAPPSFNPLAMTVEDIGLPGAIGVPDPRGPVIGDGDDPLAVRAPPADICAVDVSAAEAAKDARFPRAIEVPDPQRAILGPVASSLPSGLGPVSTFPSGSSGPSSFTRSRISHVVNPR